MSFQDELNKKSKTQQELDADLRKSMDRSAHSEYMKIKEYMLLKVKNGEFSTLDNKKCVTVYQRLYFDLAKLVKEDEVPTKQSIGFLGLQTRTVIKKRIIVDPLKRKEYDYFINSIKEYGSKDGMEIVPVIYSSNENIEYTIPTPVIGIYLVGFYFCLKCTMVY